MTFLEINWRILLLSFVLACGLWYAVTVRDRMEVQAEVALHYRGMPENLMVREGMLKSFTVLVRGPKELVRNLDPAMLTYSVDVSQLRPGTNVFVLSAPRPMMESRAFDVMDLVPNKIVLEAEGVVESAVPLEPLFSVPALAQAVKAENLQVIPASVNVRGPESVIRKIQSLKLDVPLESVATGDYRVSLPVSTPPQVTVAPGTVLAHYSIAAKRAFMEFERRPLVELKVSQPYRILPQQVMLRVELPEWLMGDKKYLEQIRVVIKDFPLSGSGEVKPSVELPPGTRLVAISPDKLNVTKAGK